MKNFSDGFERFILVLKFDKTAPNEYNSTKTDKKICNPHSLHASMRSAEYQTTVVLLKFLIITRIIYTNVLTIIQSKSLPVSGL